MSLITITATDGCNAGIIAEKVAYECGFDLYDDMRIQSEAGKMGIESDELARYHEKAPGFFQRLLMHRPEIYLNFMAAVIFELGRRDEAIIFGHASPYFLSDFDCAFHIRIHASQKYRLKTIMNEQNIDDKTATEILKAKDEALRGFFNYYLKLDPENFSLYDMIINIDKLDVDGAVKLVTSAIKNGIIDSCSLSSIDAMEKLSLQKRVEAVAVKNNLDINELKFEVTEPGHVVVNGIVSPISSPAFVKELIENVPGVKEVDVKAKRQTLPSIG